MNTTYRLQKQAEVRNHFQVDFGRAANDLCQRALNDARMHVHPLLGTRDAWQLERRTAFVLSFRLALEQRIAHKLALWQPGVQAVFKFDETWMENPTWDGSIHLLLKLPRLSNGVKWMGKRLDRGLVKCLRQLGWARFQRRESILDLQQVTPHELRHGVSYGAMFAAVYSRPEKVWPVKTN